MTDHEQVGSLQLAGSGTLVQVGDSLYVLTAAHVWEEVLKSASKIGTTLPEDLNHRFLMDIDPIVPVGAPKLPKWTEWGPDIIFLRIPPECVGAIKPFRVFYNLSFKGPFQQQKIALKILKLGLSLARRTPLGSFQPHTMLTYRSTRFSVQLRFPTQKTVLIFLTLRQIPPFPTYLKALVE